MPDLINGKFVYDPDTDEPAKTEEEWPDCPICGNRWPTKFFLNDSYEIVGCDECIQVRYLD